MEHQSLDQAIQTSLEAKSPPNVDEEKSEIKQLRMEKEVLEGKIRGYMTLSDIYHEHMEEHKRLKSEYEKLQLKLKHQNLSETGEKTIIKQTDNNRSISVSERLRTSIPDEQTRPATSDVSTPVFSESFDSLSHSESDPKNHDEHISSSHSDTSLLNNQTETTTHTHGRIKETIPMQESMVEEFPRTEESRLPDVTTEQHLEQVSRAIDNDLIQFSGPIPLLQTPYTPGVSTNQSNALKSLEMLNIEESLETGKAADVVASHVRRIVEEVEAKYLQLQQANYVLIEENKNLKKKLQNQQRLNTAVFVSQQAVEQSSPEHGWVNVIKEGKQTQPEESEKKTDKVEALHKKIAELKSANQRWVQEWDKLQAHVQSQVYNLQTERDTLTHQLNGHKIQEEKNLLEYEQKVNELTKKCQDEEAAKEEALQQLSEAGYRTVRLQDRLTSAEDKLNQLERQKQKVDTELSALKRSTAASETASGAKLDIAGKGTKVLRDLSVENEVLRQQLLVFQEDFDNERQDRASAQSEKTELKKQNETLKKRNRTLEQKVATLEKQKKNAEDALHNAIGDKEKLQQDLCEAQNEVRRLQESNKMPQYRPPPNYLQTAAQTPVSPSVVPSQPFNMRPMYHAPQQAFMGAPNPTTPIPQYMGHTQGPMPQRYGYYPVEILPGAWNCKSCTYANYPGRTVCEMCGFVQQHEQVDRTAAHASNGGGLRPRGEPHNTGVGH